LSEPKKYMTIEEAAEFLRIPLGQFRKLATEKYENLPAIKIGKRYIFRSDLLDKWYEQVVEKKLNNRSLT